MSTNKKNNKTIKGTKQAFNMGAESMAQTAVKCHKQQMELNPEINLEKATRRALYGANGMQAELHTRSNIILSSMTDKAVSLFNKTNLVPDDVIKTPKQGGISGYGKSYAYFMLECSANGIQPEALNKQPIRDAFAKLGIDKGAVSGCKFTRFLIDALKEGKPVFTKTYWIAHTEHDGFTQGGYLFRLLCRMGCAKQIASGAARAIEVDYNHPLIAGLLKLTK